MNVLLRGGGLAGRAPLAPVALLGLSLAGCPDFPAHLLVPAFDGTADTSALPDAVADGASSEARLDAGPPRPDGPGDALAPTDADPALDLARDAPADTTDAATDALAADAQPDGPVPDLPVPDLQPDGGCSVVHDPSWWSPDYAYRVQLTIAETVSGTVAAGYSVQATIDTQSLIAAGKLLASGDDLRVVYHDGATHHELHRRIVDHALPTTAVWFKTPAILDGSDSGYFVYYGHPGAGAPPAHWSDSMGAGATPSAVYLAADDFEEHPVGATPDGWEGSSSYVVELDANNNKVLGVTGASGPADYLFAGDLGWTDVVVSARLRVVEPAGQHYGLWVRADGTSSFRTVFWGLSDNSTLQVWSCRIASPTATALSSSSLLRSWALGSPAGTSWHHLEVRAAGQQLQFFFDDQLQGSTTLLATQMQQGRVGLCAGYPVTRAWWDDVVVRRYVNPEPSATAAAEQQQCP